MYCDSLITQIFIYDEHNLFDLSLNQCFQEIVQDVIQLYCFEFGRNKYETHKENDKCIYCVMHDCRYFAG